MIPAVESFIPLNIHANRAILGREQNSKPRIHVHLVRREKCPHQDEKGPIDSPFSQINNGLLEIGYKLAGTGQECREASNIKGNSGETGKIQDVRRTSSGRNQT